MATLPSLLKAENRITIALCQLCWDHCDLKGSWEARLASGRGFCWRGNVSGDALSVDRSGKDAEQDGEPSKQV